MAPSDAPPRPVPQSREAATPADRAQVASSNKTLNMFLGGSRHSWMVAAAAPPSASATSAANGSSRKPLPANGSPQGPLPANQPPHRREAICSASNPNVGTST